MNSHSGRQVVNAIIHRQARHTMALRESNQLSKDAKAKRYALFVQCLPKGGAEFSAKEARSAFCAHPDGPWLSPASLFNYLRDAMDDGVICRVADGRYRRCAVEGQP